MFSSEAPAKNVKEHLLGLRGASHFEHQLLVPHDWPSKVNCMYIGISIRKFMCIYKYIHIMYL